MVLSCSAYTAESAVVIPFLFPSFALTLGSAAAMLQRVSPVAQSALLGTLADSVNLGTLRSTEDALLFL